MNDYNWLAQEPGQQGLEYDGVASAVEFVLAPVTAWSARLRMELTEEMAKSARAGLYSWPKFIGEKGGERTLIRQVTDLAAFGVPPSDVFSSPPESPFDYDDREYPYMVLSPRLVEQGLDWLWNAFACRLDDRARAAAWEDGTFGLDKLCDEIAGRFDVRARWTPQLAGWMTTEEAEEYKRRAREAKTLEESMALINLLPHRTSHELWPVVDLAAIKEQVGGDWNGWEDQAWLRFVEATDSARQRHYESARKADVRREAEEARTSDLYGPKPPPRPEIGGYFAPEYAAQLREAYRAKHHLIRSFRALRDAAKLTEAQERTVKRSVGYEQGDVKGFSAFVRLLFAAVGESVPE